MVRSGDGCAHTFTYKLIAEPACGHVLVDDERCGVCLLSLACAVLGSALSKRRQGDVQGACA